MPIDRNLSPILHKPSTKKLDTFEDDSDALFDVELPKLVDDLNIIIPQVNTMEANINAKEESAVSAALVAVSATNFQGIWTNQMTEEKQSWLFDGIVYMVLIPGNTSPSASPSNWKALPNIKTVNGFSADSAGNIIVESKKGASIASASTTTIGTSGIGNTIHITGTTAITSLGIASQDGVIRTLIFDGILTLTHHATSLILTDGVNITTAVGDSAEFVCENGASGYWRLLRYTKIITPSFASTAEAQAGIENTKPITSLRLRDALNASGSAPIAAIRAKGNFYWNGSEIVINGSLNIASIIRVSAEVYTITMANAMPDMNYIVFGSGKRADATVDSIFGSKINSTTQFTIYTSNGGGAMSLFSDIYFGVS